MACWFGLDGVEILEIYEAEKEVEDWIDTHNADLGEMLLPRVLAPFKYEHNLTGVRAQGFFGAAGTRYGVRLAAAGGHHLLLASRL
jgi:hypothetical protein